MILRKQLIFNFLTSCLFQQRIADYLDVEVDVVVVVREKAHMLHQVLTPKYRIHIVVNLTIVHQQLHRPHIIQSHNNQNQQTD